MGVPEALFDDGEGDVLGLFRAEKRRDSFPLPLLAALLKLSTCLQTDLSNFDGGSQQSGLSKLSPT